MNTAIIVAAGASQRFNSATPKQFIEVCGKQVVIHSIERFAACSSVDEIVVVVPEDVVEDFGEREDIASIDKLKGVVAGGRTRAESVHRGMGVVDPRTEVVAIHDGARPLVTVEEIALVIQKAVETGAACLTAPVVDTIKQVEDGWITGTIDRRTLRRAMTPQAFNFALLQDAFEGRELTDEITDECSLIEELGHHIASVAGGTRNIKITHPEDLRIAEEFLREGY